MPGKFTVPVLLSQPSARGNHPTEHTVFGRRVADGGGSLGVIDGAVAAHGTSTWQVDRPPGGIGTRWRARIAGIEHEIDSAVKEEPYRPVWTLTLTSTALTGTMADTPPLRQPPPRAPGSGS